MSLHVVRSRARLHLVLHDGKQTLCGADVANAELYHPWAQHTSSPSLCATCDRALKKSTAAWGSARRATRNRTTVPAS